MQAARAFGLRINRRHPDAKGCVFAMPFNSDVVGLWGRSAWTGSPVYTVLPSGRALSFASTASVDSSGSRTAPSSGITVMVRANPTSSATQSCLKFSGGNLFFDATTNFPNFIDEGVTTNLDSAIAANLGVENVIGFRWSTADNKAVWFVNGVKDSPAATATRSFSARTIQVGRWSASYPFAGSIRDVRIWDRAMPDAAFARYRATPNAFYTNGYSSFIHKLRSSGLGNFLPFLHPSLQS